MNAGSQLLFQPILPVVAMSSFRRGNFQPVPMALTPAAPAEDFCYVRLGLAVERLTPPLERRLAALGLECIEAGTPFEAYGIVRNSARSIARLLNDDAVQAVDVEEPPAGK